MKINIAQAKVLLQLKAGETLPSSKINLKLAIWQKMVEDQLVLVQQINRRSKSIFLNPNLPFDAYLQSHFGIDDLEQYLVFLEEKEKVDRASAIKVSSDSKVRHQRTFFGFMVTVLEPLTTTLNGQEFILHPTQGAFHFIYDYEQFIIPEDVVVVGVENAENFRQLHKQKHLFTDGPYMFVSRYPQNKDFVRWMQKNNHPYLHFGDFDFAGINIFLSEYATHLGDRAKLLIPHDFEFSLAKYGNKKLYDQQLNHYQLAALPKEYTWIIELFHQYKKCLEQEVFIES
ncbi:hypothetical protein [Persicobacter psychrovividus]|uniref:Wadjet protein JetD C-terminal domain-containing protein n=1 Tax=Persicobacter psychrovividus TaxID=387638 RepID=A0ABN6LG34_9BACT|nr:hypothetical protein PEPS_43880 [Persicobacter psychrovividus]